MCVISGSFPVIIGERSEKAVEDRKILELYFERQERAIEETDKKYGRYCHSISYNILESHEDAAEIVNDTYLKVWNTVPPKKPDPLKPYVGIITRNLSLNRWEKRNALKRGGEIAVALDELSECIGGDDGDVGEGVVLSDAINRFLKGISSDTRRVFVRRYFYVSSIKEIANDYNMKESAVSMMLARTREKLRTFLEKEGFFV